MTKKNFYLPLAFILMSSKTYELYKEIFIQLKKFIKLHSSFEDFSNIKIMTDF